MKVKKRTHFVQVDIPTGRSCKGCQFFDGEEFNYCYLFSEEVRRDQSGRPTLRIWNCIAEFGCDEDPFDS